MRLFEEIRGNITGKSNRLRKRKKSTLRTFASRANKPFAGKFAKD